MSVRLGHRRDAEINALYDYAIWISATAKAHADDAELCAFKRVVCLSVLQEMSSDMAQPAKPTGGTDDRIADCNDCRREGTKGCFDENGAYIGCKWFSPKCKVEFVRRKFGDKALDLLKKYPKRKGGQNT